MNTQLITSILMKISVAFGVLAFSLALGMGLLSGVSITLSLYRSVKAAAVFAVAGGIFSLILMLFFSEDDE
ncbi:MAG TPA: hypothetical protein DDZ83_18385 [Nitrospinae bacterium]|nr:hypothetical protein [Nitrospinota bacterium]